MQFIGINIKSLILRCGVDLENLHPNKLHAAAGIPGAETPLLEFKNTRVKCAFYSVCLSLLHYPHYLFQVALEKTSVLSCSSGPHHKEKMSCVTPPPGVKISSAL